MRYRSRSRNYDSGERYKGHRSPEKYESSRRHKSKEVNSHYSSENRKNESSKYKKSSDVRSRYDYHRESESEDKQAKKGESGYDRDYKTSKSTKYERDDSTHEKKSRKSGDYTHTYRRKSVSSDYSNESVKQKHNDEKSDRKKCYYKEAKRSKISRSPSSEHRADEKIKQEVKEKKDKKIKKKVKKNEKEKIDKKKKKKQRHSLDDEKTPDAQKDAEVKGNSKAVKSEPRGELDGCSKDKVKLEPFKVKEASAIKSQINVLNSSNIFTKDEWQKEASVDETVKKKRKNIAKENTNETKAPIPQIKEEKVVKKLKPTENDAEDSNKKKRHKDSKQKVPVKVVKISKEKEVVSSENTIATKLKRSHSHSKLKTENKEKKLRDHKVVDDSTKKSEEYLSEDERLELPRTPTDAQFAGLFTRLPEESVSDTDIEDILPPMLLDARMNALLDTDPNVAQETWDSDDDVLLNKRESIVAPKHRGVLETLSVPWQLLIDEVSSSLTNRTAVSVQLGNNASLRQYDVPNMLTGIGVSYKLAGDVLWNSIGEKYGNIFLSPIAPIHQSLMLQKTRRSTIFRERSPFAGALSARKDFVIRRALLAPTI